LVGTSGGTGTDGAGVIMQKFWDSTMDIGSLDDDSDKHFMSFNYFIMNFMRADVEFWSG
jgi:hypothetical protein